MGLVLLVMVVALGVGAIVFAVHLSGGSAHARLVDQGAALKRFAIDYPEHDVVSVSLASEGETAFLLLEDDHVGIVHALGDRFLTRLLSAGDLAHAPRLSGASLTVRFHDFTWPGSVFRFSDAAQAHEVLVMLERLRAPEHAGMQ